MHTDAQTTRRSALSDAVGFLGQYLQNPLQVGSLVPSSAALVKSMLHGVAFDALKVVVEFGPGTGAMTSKILERLHPSATYYALEPNPTFQEHLRERYPQVRVVDARAEEATDHLAQVVGQVDAVFSGVPFSFMARETNIAAVEATGRLLRAGGHFRTFLYHHIWLLPKIMDLRALMARVHSSFETVPVWANVPPAMVLRCVK